MSELAFPGAGEAAIESVEELAGAFAAAAKPPERHRVGFEVECFGVEAATGDPIPFAGPSGVEAVLRHMAEEFGWERVLEAGRPVGLSRGDERVSLEPGGQIELSSRPGSDLFGLACDFERFRFELASAARPLGVAFLALGAHPFATVDRIGWVPKARYERMREYLPGRGHLAHHMMKGTASIQASFDFCDEADMGRKLRVGMALAPFVLATFANSALSSGHPNGYQSLRGHIWRYTDPSRSGLLRAVLERDRFGYEDYVQFALDVPMMLLSRGGRYVDPAGVTFRDFLAGAAGGEAARFGDWSLHLSGIFTEVRLKTILEMRSADAQRPDRALAVPAFWKGLLYHAPTLATARAMVDDWTYDELARLMEDGCRRGLDAEFRGRPVHERMLEVLALAARGLDAQGVVGPGGAAGHRFLAPVRRGVGAGRAPACEVLDAWNAQPTRIREWVLETYRI